MLYILLIVLAIIIDSWIPIAVGIALWLIATWEPESPGVRNQRRMRKAAARARKNRLKR